jgi:hypothetical protein
MVTQFANKTSLGRPENFAKYLVPGIPHYLQKRRHIPLGNRPFRIDAILSYELTGVDNRLVLVRTLKFAIDKWPEARLECLKRLSNAFMIGDGHVSPLLKSTAVVLAREASA